jgi:hypothetical protein
MRTGYNIPKTVWKIGGSVDFCIEKTDRVHLGGSGQGKSPDILAQLSWKE